MLHEHSAKTDDPTVDPTIEPTYVPTNYPSKQPSWAPSVDPTADPTEEPTGDPSADPTEDPTIHPTVEPTTDPTLDPTRVPSIDPTQDPTNNPTTDPTDDPIVDPSRDPTRNPTTFYPTTRQPTKGPTTAIPTLNADVSTDNKENEGELVDDDTNVQATEVKKEANDNGDESVVDFVLEDTMLFIVMILVVLLICAVIIIAFLLRRNCKKRRNMAMSKLEIEITSNDNELTDEIGVGTMSIDENDSLQTPQIIHSTSKSDSEIYSMAKTETPHKNEEIVTASNENITRGNLTPDQPESDIDAEEDDMLYAKSDTKTTGRK